MGILLMYLKCRSIYYILRPGSNDLDTTYPDWHVTGQEKVCLVIVNLVN